MAKNDHRWDHPMRILDDRTEIERAQQAFEKAVSAVARKVRTQIGYPSGHLDDAPVYWIASADLWAYFGLPPGGKSPGMRYWNAFGLGNPATPVSIRCEINPPVQGIDRRPAGAFGRSRDNLYILHRGNFNAYRGRIPQDFVRANFDGKCISADDGDRDSELLMVGKLEDPRFVYDLRDFVKAAIRLKEHYKAR